MYKYIDLLLVEDSDGIPYVVIAPPYKSHEGQLAVFDGHVGKVVKRDTVNSEDDTYAILSAMLPIHEADGLYDPRYVKEDDADE